MSVLRQLEVVAQPLPILARLACAVTTLEDLYVVPAGGARASRLHIANRSGSTRTYRVSIAPLGAGDATSHYYAYDVTIAANATEDVNLDVVLVETDVVRFYGSAADLTATLFGTAP